MRSVSSFFLCLREATLLRNAGTVPWLVFAIALVIAFVDRIRFARPRGGTCCRDAWQAVLQ
jgi:hypothetical protein